MRKYSALILIAVLLTSMAAASSWKELFSGWLLSFLPWEQPAQKAASQHFSANTVADWQTFANTASTAYQFDWPFPSIDGGQSARKWQQAQQAIQRLTAAVEPLPKAQSVRLLYHQDDFPIYFSNILHTYAPVVQISVTQDQALSELDSISLQPTILFYDPSRLEAAEANWWKIAEALPPSQPVFFLHLGTAATLPALPAHWAVYHSPQRSMESESLLATYLYGAETLPVVEEATACEPLPVGVQMGFAPPALLGFDPEELQKVDRILQQAIRRKAMPGAQLLVAKEGKIVYQKSYGHHTYQKKQAVYSSDLYDLASVTKAAATNLAIMKLYDQSRLDLKQRVRDILPELNKFVPGYYTLEQLLVHQSGLQADIPIRAYVGQHHVADQASEQYNIPISEQRWLEAGIPQQILNGLKRVGHTKRPMYRYSDINYLLLQQVVERLTELPMDIFLRQEIYEPLGLNRLLFKPYTTFASNFCVPTVEDKWMRGGLVRGYVHDEGAALLGGVAGHAGLFGNATDLAVLYQMLLNGGELNGQRIFSSATVSLFTAKSRLNYRSLGFDRVQIGWPRLRQLGVGEDTFGHLGFSGTSVWADPENELIYILLTNRVHPDPSSEIFNKLDVRGQVHQQIYRSLLRPEA